MGDVKEVLNAEETIQKLAGELERAKSIADGAEEARRQIDKAANLLKQSIEQIQMATDGLMRQNEQMLQRLAAHDQAIKRLSKLFTFCLIFSVIAATIGLFILVWLLLQT